MKPAIQLLYRLRQTLLRITRWKARGVKLMLFNPEGKLMLVRNSYGRTHLYVLPGGGIHRSETPERAAARETLEEVGIAAQGLRLVSVHRNQAEGKRDTIYLFTGFVVEAPRADGFEVEEVGFFALDDLPATVSAATLRRISEFRGERPPASDW